MRTLALEIEFDRELADDVEEFAARVFAEQLQAIMAAPDNPERPDGMTAWGMGLARVTAVRPAAPRNDSVTPRPEDERTVRHG